MTRSIPIYLSGIVEELELERPSLVTTKDISRMANRHGVKMQAPLIASRLKERGWLLQTPQRGVWEFAPAEVAGAYSSADPLLPIKAFSMANPTVKCALTFQTAAWALGLADRVPSHIEVAFADRPLVKVPEEIAVVNYKSNLSTTTAKDFSVLEPEAIVVNLVNRPSAVRSWAGVNEWLPDVVYEISSTKIIDELQGRSSSVWARTGYLLQGLRPDVSSAISNVFTPKAKVKFGTAGKSMRNDEKWQVADAALPFDPRKMEPVK